MGRSARQRRLKSVDPFNPKRGQILAAQRNPDGKDLAPNEKKEKKHIPRALREMMMGQKKIEEFQGSQNKHQAQFFSLRFCAFPSHAIQIIMYWSILCTCSKEKGQETSAGLRWIRQGETERERFEFCRCVRVSLSEPTCPSWAWILRMVARCDFASLPWWFLN